MVRNRVTVKTIAHSFDPCFIARVHSQTWNHMAACAEILHAAGVFLRIGVERDNLNVLFQEIAENDRR